LEFFLSYFDDLKHPLWQKRRLEVFNSENWKCQECQSTTKQLTVHHSIYVNKWHLWEYPDELLLSLCEDCHLERQNVEESLRIELMKRLKRVPLKRLKIIFWRVMKDAMGEPE